jgi:vancomycin resistance protein VanJ
VRLAGGVRFWRSARCPICRAAVDPLRSARILAWFRNLARPASADLLDRALWWSALAYAGTVIPAAILLWTRADVWWPVTAFLFGPRWVLALPLALLLPAAGLRDRALLLPLAVVSTLLAGPIIELRTGWRGLLTGPDPATDVRVVTYNVQGGSGLSATASGMAHLWEADILLFQECGGTLRAEIQALTGSPEGFTDASGPPLWFGDTRASLCILSRFPIHQVEEMERTALRAAGGSGLVATYELGLGGRTVRVTNLHLETPRDGFALLRSGQVLRSIPTIREKSHLRTIELAQAQRWVDRSPDLPRIVAGDFNTPPESRAYRNAWSDWTNTWTRLGRGYGGTRLNGWIRPRIDHILVDQGWLVIDARVGEDLGSDHLPVVATVRLRAGSR